MLSATRAVRSPAVVVPVRTKVIFAESFLDKAERLKLWNRETSKLFGPVLNAQSPKPKRPKNDEAKLKALRILANEYNRNSPINTRKSVLTNFNEQLKHEVRDLRYSGVTFNQNVNLIRKENISSKKYDSAEQNKISHTQLNKPRIEILASNTKNSLFTNTNVKVPSVIIRNLKTFPMLRNQKMDIEDKKADVPTDDKIITLVSNHMERMKFPSVTKILSETMSEESKAALERWKQQKISELGPEGFELFNKAQLEHGKQFHSLLSNHLTLQVTPTISSSLEGVWSSVSQMLKDVTTPKAVESHVVHPVLKYKGMIDCIAFYQDKPTLIEWKKSDKPKHILSSTYDNPIQLAAYFGAVSHDTNYKQLNVRDALLVIAYTDGAPADVFHINMEQMRQHWATWLTRLEKYWTVMESKHDNAKDVDTKNL